MKRTILLLAVSLAFVAGCGGNAGTHAPASYHRVISFAPSITETLFALGVGDRVVGVTRYCNYPPQVKNLPKVGGYTDPNFEIMLSLKPDLVLTLNQHSTLSEFLQKNGIARKAVDNESFDAILKSFSVIGAMFGKTHQADSIVAAIRSAISDTAQKKDRPRIFLCVGRDNPGAGSITKVYAAGPKSFYNTLIRYGGGVNAYSDSSFIYPSVSAEGIIRISPDIIIDLMNSASGLTPVKARDDWRNLSMIPAVKNELVFCSSDDFMTIPGPRIGLILEYIKQAVELCRDRRGQ